MLQLRRGSEKEVLKVHHRVIFGMEIKDILLVLTAPLLTTDFGPPSNTQTVYRPIWWHSSSATLPTSQVRTAIFQFGPGQMPSKMVATYSTKVRNCFNRCKILPALTFGYKKWTWPPSPTSTLEPWKIGV